VLGLPWHTETSRRPWAAVFLCRPVLDPHQARPRRSDIQLNHPLSDRSRRMKLQHIFEKSENMAVATIVLIFIVLHFGLLYLFTHV
jgi:hypothetical protein